MKVFIIKRQHGKYNFLLNWQNPDNGSVMGQWFVTMKDLREYIRGWFAEIIFINEQAAR